MGSLLRPALSLLALTTLLTGVAYPAAVTGLAQLLFPDEAEGSLLREGGRVVGSALIAQPFSSPGLFWPRPSATGVPYDAANSSGSNLGPANPALAEAVRARVAALRAADPGNPAPVPVDLVTASGSGLDPHLSVAAALYQVRRVAAARGLAEGRVRAVVEASVEGRWLGLTGEERVNVLRLNLLLARL